MFKFRATRIEKLEKELSDLKEMHDKNIMNLTKWGLGIERKIRELELKIDSN